MAETVDELTKRFADQLAPNLFSKLQGKLMAQHQETVKQLLDEEDRLAETAATIEAARRRVDDWPVEHNDFWAIYDGLRRVYKRGRNRLADAYAEPIPENFHEWR
jgi:hypothetical protein